MYHSISEAKDETFAQARDRILKYLASKGWKTKPSLKVPQAISPDGDVQLFFKTQAIYKGDHSLVMDMRVDAEQFEKFALGDAPYPDSTLKVKTKTTKTRAPKISRNPRPLAPPAASTKIDKERAGVSIVKAQAGWVSDIKDCLKELSSKKEELDNILVDIKEATSDTIQNLMDPKAAVVIEKVFDTVRRHSKQTLEYSVATMIGDAAEVSEVDVSKWIKAFKDLCESNTSELYAYPENMFDSDLRNLIYDAAVTESEDELDNARDRLALAVTQYQKKFIIKPMAALTEALKALTAIPSPFAFKPGAITRFNEVMGSYTKCYKSYFTTMDNFPELPGAIIKNANQTSMFEVLHNARVTLES